MCNGGVTIDPCFLRTALIYVLCLIYVLFFMCYFFWHSIYPVFILFSYLLSLKLFKKINEVGFYHSLFCSEQSSPLKLWLNLKDTSDDFFFPSLFRSKVTALLFQWGNALWLKTSSLGCEEIGRANCFWLLSCGGRILILLSLLATWFSS